MKRKPIENQSSDKSEHSTFGVRRLVAALDFLHFGDRGVVDMKRKPIEIQSSDKSEHSTFGVRRLVAALDFCRKTLDRRG